MRMKGSAKLSNILITMSVFVSSASAESCPIDLLNAARNIDSQIFAYDCKIDPFDDSVTTSLRFPASSIVMQSGQYLPPEDNLELVLVCTNQATFIELRPSGYISMALGAALETRMLSMAGQLKSNFDNPENKLGISSRLDKDVVNNVTASV